MKSSGSLLESPREKKYLAESPRNGKKETFNLRRIDQDSTKILISKTLVNLHSKFFSVSSHLSQSFDELMIGKGHQVFVKEFNQEMTIRDINKISRTDLDNITEHSFMVSNRDFDFFANDSMKIAFAYDERKSILPINFTTEKKESSILKSPFAFSQSVPLQDKFEIKLRTMENEVINEESENKFRFSKISGAYAFDEYFKNNEINEIKI